MRSHPAGMAQQRAACFLCGSSIAAGLPSEDASTHSTVPPASKGPTIVTSDVTEALQCWGSSLLGSQSDKAPSTILRCCDRSPVCKEARPSVQSPANVLRAPMCALSA